MLNKEERRALDILEKTTMKKGNRYEVGLIWKNEEKKLPNNRYLAVTKLKLTENKFNRNPDVATEYKDTVSRYARKSSKKEANSNSSITNYIAHHSVANPNKRGKLCVVYDARA